MPDFVRPVNNDSNVGYSGQGLYEYDCRDDNLMGWDGVFHRVILAFICPRILTEADHSGPFPIFPFSVRVPVSPTFKKVKSSPNPSYFSILITEFTQGAVHIP